MEIITKVKEMEHEISITGDRVILRAAGEQDLKMLQSLIRDPEIVKVTKGYQNPVSRKSPADRDCFWPVPVGSLRRVIADRKDPGPGLGLIMLSGMDEEKGTAQIYIKLLKSARGRGYGRDAVEALVSYAFEALSLNGIYSGILEDNMASRRLFEACGFRREKTHEGSTDRDGNSRRVCIYVRKAKAAAT